MTMDLIGEIRSEPDPPGIDRRRWIDAIRDHPNLVPPEPREGINPFTKKPMAIQPRPDVARIVVDEEEVGAMEWAQDDSNMINVFGDPKAVIPLARDIAELLAGRFEEWRGE